MSAMAPLLRKPALRLLVVTALWGSVGCNQDPAVAQIPAAPPAKLVSLAGPAIVEPGQSVSLTSTAPFNWRLRDAGTIVVRGSAMRAGAAWAASVPLRQPGYFDLETSDAAGAAVYAVASVPPHLEPSDRFGVVSHFAQGWDISIIPLVRTLGVDHVRDEAYWSGLEGVKGKLKPNARYDAYMAAFKANGVEPLLTLSFGNKYYDEGQAPTTPEGRAAYARYAAFATQTYAAKPATVEVWNEYNEAFCKGPCQKDRPGYYTQMLRETYRALKRQNRSTKVVGAVTVNIPMPYLKQLFALGALKQMDVLSIHPYAGSPEQNYARVLELRQAMRAAGGEKPIWITEVGKSFRAEQDRPKLASYMLKTTALMTAAGVERTYWYLLKDYKGFKGMGLIRGPDDPKGENGPTPGFVAYSTAVRQLDRATFVRREPSDRRTYILRFTRGGQDCLVVWSTDGAALLRLRAKGPVSQMNWMGRASQIPVEADGPTVPADREPVFLIGKISGVEEER